MGKPSQLKLGDDLVLALKKAVASHVKEWAAAIGLKRTDAGFAEFSEDLTWALRAFVAAHSATPGRWRWSNAKKAFLDLANDYTTISKLLRHWENGRGLPPVHVDPRFESLPLLNPEPAVLRAALAPYGNTARFAELAAAAQHYASVCVPDNGSRPRTFAFDVLCFELEKVFKERRAPERGGDYFQLVKAVWPVAREVAQAATKQPLPDFTSAALGKRLQRLFPRLSVNLEPGTKPSKLS